MSFRNMHVFPLPSIALTHVHALPASELDARKVGTMRGKSNPEACHSDRLVGAGRGRLFRARFIAECGKHLSDADPIADLAERPEDYFQLLWLESLLANRLGHPPPHPWFTEFCLRYITDEIDGLVHDDCRVRYL